MPESYLWHTSIFTVYIVDCEIYAPLFKALANYPRHPQGSLTMGPNKSEILFIKQIEVDQK